MNNFVKRLSLLNKVKQCMAHTVRIRVGVMFSISIWCQNKCNATQLYFMKIALLVGSYHIWTTPHQDNSPPGQLPTRTIPHHTGLGPNEWVYWLWSWWGVVLGIVVPVGNRWVLFIYILWAVAPVYGVVLNPVLIGRPWGQCDHSLSPILQAGGILGWLLYAPQLHSLLSPSKITRSLSFLAVYSPPPPPSPFHPDYPFWTQNRTSFDQ